MGSLDRSRSLSDLRDLDWDFATTSAGSPFAQFHWHPARFPAQIPAISIEALSPPGGAVLDPFCGSGTTLVEAIARGRGAIGIDTNPVATLISSAKTAAIDLAQFAFAARALLGDVERSLGASGHDGSGLAVVPNLNEQVRWYEDRTLDELGRIWGAISKVDDVLHRLLFTASFSAILRFVCSQPEHWGWICDNVRPKVLTYRPAISRFAEKVWEFSEAAGDMPAPEGRCPVAVLTGSCAEVLARFDDEVVDLVVTSPPYFGVTDYVKAQRLTYLWLDLELESDRRSETGARSKRHRQIAHAQYLNEMASCFQQITRVLKRGSRAVVVIGESARRPSTLGEVAGALKDGGLELETAIHRRLPPQRTKMATMESEQVWILRRG